MKPNILRQPCGPAGRLTRWADCPWARKSLIGSCFLGLVAGVLAAETNPPMGAVSEPALNGAPVLTNAAQILSLSAAAAQAGLPVRICGIVTCYDPGRVLFVQDQTAGVFVYDTSERLPLREGQYVQVTGTARPGRYSPIIASPTFHPMESRPAIQPLQATVAEVFMGGLDAQWVELTGVVRSQKLNDHRLLLELVDSPHRLSVWIPDYEGYEQLPLRRSLARIRGVVGTYVSDRGELTGFQLRANNLSDITILQAAPADPFAIPPCRVVDFRSHWVRTNALAPVRIQGQVTLCWPGRALFLQDTTGGIEVQTQGPVDDLAPGTAVDAVGYLGPVLGPPLLEDALMRRLATAAPQPPARLLPEDLWDSRYNCRLIEVEAELRGRANSTSNGVVLALQADNQFFTAQLHVPQPEQALPALEPGSRLRLTGVGLMQAGAGPAMTLLLRSPADVQLLRSALPLRHPRLQALATAALLTSAGLALALWFIQRQRRRTEHVLQLQAALQAEMLQSEQQLRRSMQERERIGRDLHDDIMQSIYAVGLSLEDCRRVIRQSPEQAGARLLTAINTLNQTIRSVRGFIAGLEPKLLNGREFKTALKSLALTSGDGLTQFQIDVDPAAANGLTSTEATQLLHIAKEAISNGLRHAHGSAVTVSLHQSGNGPRLEVHDDGVGFDPATVPAKGQGLRNMAARAREIGADLQLISAPGQGCRMVVTVPQRNANEHD